MCRCRSLDSRLCIAWFNFQLAFQCQHILPKRNILSHSCYCGLLCVFAFQDQHTLPKRNILSHSCYCGLLCVFAFQDQHTLPKRNILSKLLLWLARMELPFSTNTPSQSEIFYIYIYIDEQSTITENISLWEGVLVLKGQYLRTTYNNREYFTLGGCGTPERR